MSISILEVLEDDEFFDLPACKCCGSQNRGVSGWIQDGATSVARYFAYWTEGQSSHGVSFDLILGKFGPSDSPGHCKAVSINYHAMSGSIFIDAKARPFAKRQALYCQFPSPISLSGELVTDSIKIVKFIIHHDPRIKNI